MNTSNEDREEVMDNSAYNPFPEPQAIPSGWDTSMFSFASQTETALDEEDSAES